MKKEFFHKQFKIKQIISQRDGQQKQKIKKKKKKKGGTTMTKRIKFKFCTYRDKQKTVELEKDFKAMIKRI